MLFRSIETLLFSVALAVGLSPELLPAILSVNLARAARKMASGGVIVRRLSAIENLGSMDVLCTDKTGTLTEGVDPKTPKPQECSVCANAKNTLPGGIEPPTFRLTAERSAY